jgi:hypothetical protein
MHRAMTEQFAPPAPRTLTVELPAPPLRDKCGADVHPRLRRLRAVVLLDGTVRRSPFAEALDRSLLELPIASGQTLLDLWRQEVAQLAESQDLPALRCRIMVGHTTRAPALRWGDREAAFSAEADPSSLRGTGGVLRDLAEEHDDDDLLLVGNAVQLLVEPLHVLAREMCNRGGDVTVAANGDGAPSSLALLSCRALRQLPRVGFVDLKEQGLPLMSRSFEVTTLWRSSAYGLPIRTPRDYLTAVRAHHRLARARPAMLQPFEERWQRTFALVEEGALVSADATLHDAVVLRGAQVAAGALVADSILCAGADVRGRENVLRRVAHAGGRAAIDSYTH